jgi:hypothetical protein
MVKGYKAAQLETVSEGRPGPGRGKVSERTAKKKNHHSDGSFSTATNERLRAINRAPESVRKLYEQDKLSQVWAAKLGPKNPSPQQAAKVAEIAQALKGVSDRKTSDSLVKQMLGARPASGFDRALAIVKTMAVAERKRFIQTIRRL